MIRRFTFISTGYLLLQFLLIALYSCNEDKTNKCKVVESITLSVIDNGGLNQKSVQNNIVYAKALLIRANVKQSVNICLKSEVSPFVNAAYASYKKNDYKRSFYLTSTHVYADHDFDSKHPAGSDIKDLFVIKGDDYYLMSAPDDTSLLFSFSVKNIYNIDGYSSRDTSLMASTNPLKLKK